MSKEKFYRYPAFTVLELLIVMLLTVLTISVTLAAFEMFNKMFLSYQNHASRMTDLTTMQRVLSRDIFRSETVVRNERGVICHYNEKDIKYLWEEEYCIREAERSDTFYIQILECRNSCEGKEQYIEGALIDYCSMQLKSQQDTLTWVFAKEYSSEQKMRYREKYGYQENSTE